MNPHALLVVGLAVLASTLGHGNSQSLAQAESGSKAQQSAQDPVTTPMPTIKPLDMSKLTLPPSATGHTTLNPGTTLRPDPRQTEPPTPEPTPAPTPAPTPDPSPWETKTIGHDEVKPFPEPKPVTVSEKAGAKFKPQIQVRTGCVPYPAVDEFGQTSGGLKPTGNSKGGCRGSGHGSQVYGRGTWMQGVWAIMYSWYFPKDSPSPGMGHRHDWEHAIVFIDNPDVPEPKILACSVSSHDGYSKYNPCPPWVIDGTSLKVRYKHGWPSNHDLDTTGDAGSFQDLIMWDQMTENARKALNSVSFGKANTPFNDGNFKPKLERAWPF